MKLQPFEGAKAKLERAKHHLRELEPAFREGGVNTDFGVSFFQDDNGELVARANIPRELFIRFAVMTGEIVHQTRSALEHAKLDCRQNREAMKLFETPGSDFRD